MSLSTFDGNSTPNVVKLGLEAYLSYNLGTIKNVGKFVSDGAGAGTYTAQVDAPAFDVSGENIMIRTTAPIYSTVPMVVTVTGTDEADAPLTGTATIAAGVTLGQAYKVAATGDAKFKTVTSASCATGLLGDGFELCTMLDHDNDVELGFAESMGMDPGTEVKPIYKHYDLDHNKRIRGDKKLTVVNPYFTNLKGLSLINNRDTVIIVQIHDDGGNLASEVWIIDKCRLGVKHDVGAGVDEIKENADGTFGRAFIFS
jgi:hypothetical protein